MSETRVVSVIGLGYVGLPVAVAMSEKFKTYGFDVKESRVEELSRNTDSTKEVTTEELKNANIVFTSDIQKAKEANFHIVAVPTPIDESKRPDLTLCYKASETVGKILKPGDIVVYESTVYPGATEDEFVPILEKVSGLKSGKDFSVGYSPERINPGDKEHSFKRIVKVVSGFDELTLKEISRVYGAVVDAGIYEAESIRVAEASKAIENAQRDINIAFANELSLIFDRMNIDTKAVLDAANTKWNFLNFRPGLVGGHCIGVDPYYLTHKAQLHGYYPDVLLAGRRVNDSMGEYAGKKTVEFLSQAGVNIPKAKVTLLGLTFKEDCPDLRNSRVQDIVNELKRYSIEVQLHDPQASANEVEELYGQPTVALEKLKKSDAVILAVSHREYRELTLSKVSELLGEQKILLDLKGVFDRKEAEEKGFTYWRF